MIHLPDPDTRTRLRECVQFARQTGLLPQLRKTLKYLRDYANGQGCRYDRATGADTRCGLYLDFAPRSFSVLMQYREEPTAPWQPWFNGGLIYQGRTQPANGGAPSFTVSLAEGDGWHLHT